MLPLIILMTASAANATICPKGPEPTKVVYVVDATECPLEALLLCQGGYIRWQAGFNERDGAQSDPQTSVIKKAIESMGPDYVFVTPTQLADLYKQSR